MQYAWLLLGLFSTTQAAWNVNFNSGQKCETLRNGSPPVCRFHQKHVDFYRQFDDLPSIGSSWRDDVHLWMPGLDGCKEGCNKPVDEVTYFTWVSHEYEQPIFTGIRTNACHPNCPNLSGRGCSSFNTCCVSDVRQDDYTNSGMDRGHLVPNQILNVLFGGNAAANSFSMCNVGPQTSGLNQGWWRHLESLLNCVGQYKEMNIYAGPLFDKNPFSHCLCKGQTAGVMSCDQCDSWLHDMGGTTLRNSIPWPESFWKIVTMKEGGRTIAYTWVFHSAQDCEEDANGPNDPQCKSQKSGENIREAYAGRSGVQEIEQNLDIKFPSNWSHADGCEALNHMFDSSCSPTGMCQ